MSRKQEHKSYMYSYEYECNKCSSKLSMEIHYELTDKLYCPCTNAMDLVLYMRTPDTRAGIEE